MPCMRRRAFASQKSAHFYTILYFISSLASCCFILIFFYIFWIFFFGFCLFQLSKIKLNASVICHDWRSYHLLTYCRHSLHAWTIALLHFDRYRECAQRTEHSLSARAHSSPSAFQRAFAACWPTSLWLKSFGSRGALCGCSALLVSFNMFSIFGFFAQH